MNGEYLEHSSSRSLVAKVNPRFASVKVTSPKPVYYIGASRVRQSTVYVCLMLTCPQTDVFIALQTWHCLTWSIQFVFSGQQVKDVCCFFRITYTTGSCQLKIAICSCTMIGLQNIQQACSLSQQTEYLTKHSNEKIVKKSHQDLLSKGNGIHTLHCR